MSTKALSHLHPFIVFYTLLLIFLSLDVSPTLQISFEYNNFTNEVVTAQNSDGCPEEEKNICLLGDADDDNKGVIDLTPNSKTEGEKQKFGVAVYSQPMQLWNSQTNERSDFTTEFSFIIQSLGTGSGDGLAFFITHNPYSQNRSSGGSLGLVSTDKLFNASGIDRFVAVELDTFGNEDWDNSSTHVGIDVNSIKSEVEKNLSANLTNSHGKVHIDYNSTHSKFSVRVDYNGSSVSTMLSANIDLKDILQREHVFVGFTAATGSYTELHRIKSWKFNSTSIATKEHKSGNNNVLIIASVVTVTVSVCLVGLVVFVWNRLARRDHFVEIDKDLDEEFEDESGPRRFSYHELINATDNFDEDRKLGEGGFGHVYRGFLKDLNINVAVKRISGQSKQGRKEYITEVKIISQLRHKNLVELIGWCHRKNEFLLVYELMENKSLDSYIFDRTRCLPWPQRYKIAQGLASGLLYLHDEWKHCVVHRDVKSSNVMLDKTFNAKLGDFGLARLSEHGSGLQTTIMAGTMGYMAPECFVTWKGSKESDVYSFGIVALEIACGRKCIDTTLAEDEVKLVDFVWKMYGTEKLLQVVDKRLLNDEEFVHEIHNLMMLGLWCAHPDLNQRPTINHVIACLDFEASIPDLPPKMPIPSIPTSNLEVAAGMSGT